MDSHWNSCLVLELTAIQQDKLVIELQSQVSQLQEKVDALESKLREKDAEVEALQAAGKDKDSVSQPFESSRTVLC
jgi:outer membrane murein-binding lipoprotein Lpp